MIFGDANSCMPVTRQKRLTWLGTSRADACAFPGDLRRIAAFQLIRVQLGLHPTHFRPMTRVGGGVRELRLRATAPERILYLASHLDAVYVLHAFCKTTPQLSMRDVLLARDRLRELERLRLGLEHFELSHV
jgi:phage-related protein